MNHKLYWLHNTKILALVAVFVTFFNSNSGLAVESEATPLPIVENGNLLYINHQGKVIIDPQVKTNTDKRNDYYLASISVFYDGLAAISVNKKWGYINTNGKMVISPHLDSPGKFRNGVALIGRSGKYIDRNGKQSITQYDILNNFSEGLALIRDQRDISYIDRSGRIVIKTGDYFQSSAPDLYDFSEGLAVTSKGYIDKKGKIVISCDQKKFGCLPFHDGLAASYEQTGKVGFINKKGLLVIPRQFDRGNLFCEGIAVMKKDNKHVFINKKGNIIANPDAKLDDLMGRDVRNYANPYLFMYSPCFSDGLILVETNKKIGFMDKKGEIVISPTFSNASSFVGGAALVATADNKWGWIDKTGSFIWKSK